MGNMPSKSPRISKESTETLKSLARTIRQRRKALGVSAVAAAEAAGMSRVTLHRIEKGEASVTMGAYVNAMSVMGLKLLVGNGSNSSPENTRDGSRIPVRIMLSEYPQLRQLAWHVQGTDELSAKEAWGVYERNRRHLDPESLEPHERELLEALQTAMK